MLSTTNSRLQLACVWAGPAFIVSYIVFFWVIAGYIPPLDPAANAQEVGAFYDANRTEIRIGQLGAMVSSALLIPWWVVITGQIMRIERGRPPVLALIQLSGAILLQVFFVLCSMLWITATFRSELGADTVRVLHDLGWLIFVMVFPGYVLQMVAIAIASFSDESPDPVWPRWMGYFCLWVAASGAGGGLAVFFKEGPFAWNGLIGFYIPISAFAMFLCLMTYLMHTGIRRQARTEAAQPPPAESEQREAVLA